MRKLLISILSLTLLLCFAGCTSDPNKGKDKATIINEAIKKTMSLDSKDVTSSYSSELDFFGTMTTFKCEFRYAGADLNSDKRSTLGKMTLDIFGQLVEFNTYTDNKYLYVDAPDYKIYMDLTSEDAISYLPTYVEDRFMRELPATVLNAATATKNDDGTTTYHYALTSDEFNTVYPEYAEEQTYDGYYTVQFKDHSGDITIDKKGYVVKFAFKCVLDMFVGDEVETSSNFTCEINYNRPGEPVSVVAIDTSDYMSMEEFENLHPEYNGNGEDYEYEFDEYDYELLD